MAARGSSGMKRQPPDGGSPATGDVADRRLIGRVRSVVLAGKTRERPAALVEVALLLLVLLFFTWVHDSVGKDVAVATANALALQSIERTLHLDVALTLNRWLT